MVPHDKLKIEPWIINGWQSYNRMNGHHGFGGQILYRPKEWLSMVFNNYGNGTDTLGVPNRVRIHTDDSVEVRYYNKPESTGLSKMAFSVTGDADANTVSSAARVAPAKADNRNSPSSVGWLTTACGSTRTC